MQSKEDIQEQPSTPTALAPASKVIKLIIYDTLREILLIVLTKWSQIYIFSKGIKNFVKLTNTQKSMELSMRLIFFCKIDQIQIVWEIRIFYYCMPYLRATSKHAKQRNFLSVVLKMNNDQEELVSSAVYKYGPSTNAAFFESFPDYRERYQCW